MSTPASSPKPGSSSTTRYVLLGILAILLAAMAHDYLVAQPATNKASQELEEFALKKIGEGVNRDGEKVKDNQFVRSDDVQKILGRKPTLVKSFDNAQGGHVVEYYCYRPWLPVPEISKHYVAVVYWGKDNPRYMSHHTNMVPPADAYPDYRGDGPHGAPPEGGPPAEGAAGLAPAGAAPMGTGGSAELTGDPTKSGGGGGQNGGKGQKGGKQRPAEEGKSDDKPATEEPASEAKPSEDKPAEEKPAEGPAEDKPAEQPASEEKPAATEEKPAEAAPAEATEAKPEEAK